MSMIDESFELHVSSFKVSPDSSSSLSLITGLIHISFLNRSSFIRPQRHQAVDFVAFAVIAIATARPGHGASTAILSVVHAVLLRSLPYGQPRSSG